MPYDETDPDGKLRYSAVTQVLAGLGWTDGRNVRLDLRWAGADNNRIRALAQELVDLQLDIILTTSTPATAAVQRETRTIPIVFASVADPVASGIVARLDRPSGNVTGFGSLEGSLGGKWLELLSEIAPGLKRAAIMFNPDTSRCIIMCPHLRRPPGHSGSCQSVRPFMAMQKSKRPSPPLGASREAALSSMPGLFTQAHRAPIISAAARNNVPAVYGLSEFVRDDGLLSYGTDRIDMWRRAATYVDRILRGAKPGDLPVQFPTKFEMAVNLKTAKALGLAVPPLIRLLADEAIE
jgi:putative ABC transport system substrate-binding protein